MIPIPEGYILLSAGIWLTIQPFVIRTRNVRSSIYFKIVPFILGIISLLKGLQLIGWI